MAARSASRYGSASTSKDFPTLNTAVDKAMPSATVPIATVANHLSRGRIVLAAEPVHQDERHLPPVLVTVRGWVEMQYGCEQRTGPPFTTCDGHRLSPPRYEAARPRIREQARGPWPESTRLCYSDQW